MKGNTRNINLMLNIYMTSSIKRVNATNQKNRYKRIIQQKMQSDGTKFSMEE